MLLDACFSCVRLPASLRGSVAIVDVIQKFAVVLLLQNGAAVIQALLSFGLCIIVILDSTFFQFVESVRVRPPVRHPHANPKGISVRMRLFRRWQSQGVDKESDYNTLDGR